MGISKRLEDARAGYRKKDRILSASAHDIERIAEAHAEPDEGKGKEYLGSMVYGGLDGIITTFAIVSGVAGAELGSGVILILGLANILADGFSMGVGAYLSTKSDNEVYQREYKRETWEIEEFPEGEKAELYVIYKNQGYPDEDARKMVEIKTRDKMRWADAMMVEELNMLKTNKGTILDGLATFGAFIVAGFVPMLVYVASFLFNLDIPAQTAFYITLGLSGLALFLLGTAKVTMTGLNPIKSGLEMLIVGGIAAGVAYYVGALLKGIGG